jgi:ABC-type antimicrobial peptide transport system permease subunit
MLVAVIGAVAGLGAAFGATRFLSSMLYGVTATDALVFTSVPLILVVVALAACALPARRAMGVNPITALRYE